MLLANSLGSLAYPSPAKAAVLHIRNLREASAKQTATEGTEGTQEAVARGSETTESLSLQQEGSSLAGLMSEVRSEALRMQKYKKQKPKATIKKRPVKAILGALDALLGQCDDVGINECPQIPQQHYKKGSRVYELGTTVLEALKESKSGLTGLEGLADKATEC